MSSKNSDKRPPSKGKGSADRNKHNSVKNNYNGKHPQKLPSAKNNNNPYSPASQYNNRKNKTANAADTLDRTKKKRPVKSPPPEKKFPKEADSQMYEQVSEADIEVETSRILDRNRRKSTPKEYIKLPAPAKEPMSEYRRKLKTILFYIVTLVVLLSICFVLSLTVFFKIDDILVEGETRYQADDIIASCMIEKGDNLLLCNTSAGEKNIVDQFPYIEKVKMDKKLFNKIIINVTEAVPTSIIESGGQYIVLSKSGKIIEINDTKKYKVPTVLGAHLKNVKLSSTVKYSDKNVQNYITDIINATEKYEIKNIETIDISNLTEIVLIRKNGFKIIIGNPENIDYKIKTAKMIMTQNVTKDNLGTLNVSLAVSDGGKSYLKIESSVAQSSQEKKQASSQSQTAMQESSFEETQNDGENDTEYTGDDDGDTEYDSDGEDDTDYDDAGDDIDYDYDSEDDYIDYGTDDDYDYDNDYGDEGEE